MKLSPYTLFLLLASTVFVSNAGAVDIAPASGSSAAAQEAATETASASEAVTFRQWLFEYIPSAYPDANMVDHTHWLQGLIGDELSVNWTEWKDADSSLKAMESHGLKQGESMFIEQKGLKKDWAEHPSVTYHTGAGYYIASYDSATMGTWDGKGLSVIQFDGDGEAFAAKMAQAWARDKSFKWWLYQYIPEQFPDAQMIDHTYWLQAHLGNGLVVNWTEWTDSDSTFKAMEAHNLTPGKTMFVEQKGEKKTWAAHPAVTYYEGAGYFIAGYDPETMGTWDGSGLTVIQFDGSAESFARTTSLAWTRKNSFEDWLYQFIPVQFPAARMTDQGHWKQAHVTEASVASWEQWKVADVTLKYLEDHSLAQGKAFFIEKNEKTEWADHPSVTYYEGAGYYASGYDSATMSGWGVEGLTVIQFDGESEALAETIAKAWAAGGVPDAASQAPAASAPVSAEDVVEEHPEPAAGAPYTPHPQQVLVTKVEHFGNMCWKIATAGGTWYFENGETGGKSGFNSAFDQSGNDWIGNDADKGMNKSPNTGGRHEYRGWPNFGEGNFDHPQRSSGTKTRWVDAEGKDIAFTGKLVGEHLIMRSANADYELEYHFFPSHAAIKILKAEKKYAFLFEGPIGGEQEASVEKDYYVLKDGKHRECKPGGLGYLEAEFGNKFPSPFFYLVDSDPKDTQVLYAGVKDVGPESAGDEGWRQGLNMVIFSFGRDEDKGAYTGTDAVCVFGFFPKAPHDEVSTFIEDRLAAPFKKAQANSAV